MVIASLCGFFVSAQFVSVEGVETPLLHRIDWGWRTQSFLDLGPGT